MWGRIGEIRWNCNLPSRKLTYPTWGKGNHLQNAIFGGYVSSLEGILISNVNQFYSHRYLQWYLQWRNLASTDIGSLWHLMTVFALIERSLLRCFITPTRIYHVRKPKQITQICSTMFPFNIIQCINHCIWREAVWLPAELWEFPYIPMTLMGGQVTQCFRPPVALQALQTRDYLLGTASVSPWRRSLWFWWLFQNNTWLDGKWLRQTKKQQLFCWVDISMP